MGVDVEADPLFLQGVDQFRSETGKIHPQTLDTVVQVRINGFDYSVATTVVDVDLSLIHI